jgi:hypothetical protein
MNDEKEIKSVEEFEKVLEDFIRDGNKKQIFINTQFDGNLFGKLLSLGFEKYKTNNGNYDLRLRLDGNGKLIRVFLNKKFKEKAKKVWFKTWAFVVSDGNINTLKEIAEYYSIDNKVLLDFLNDTKSLNTLLSNNSMVGK